MWVGRSGRPPFPTADSASESDLGKNGTRLVKTYVGAGSRSANGQIVAITYLRLTSTITIAKEKTSAFSQGN